jgi:hypothetical protein
MGVILRFFLTFFVFYFLIKFVINLLIGKRWASENKTYRQHEIKFNRKKTESFRTRKKSLNQALSKT